MRDPIANVQADEMIFEVDPEDTSGSDASDSESEKVSVDPPLLYQVM